MDPELKIDLNGKFFFRQLKKKDKGYFHRLKQRYDDINTNAEKYASLTEQEMIDSYLELMDTLFEMHKLKGTNNGP